MIDKVIDPALTQGFQLHLGETNNQIMRLERLFTMYGLDINRVGCAAIDGILEKAEDIAGEAADSCVMHAALLTFAKAFEHYEITRYGTLIAKANELGREDRARVLQKNLDEEKVRDQKLSQRGEGWVNYRAA